jgi:Uma2 family endonuclease
MESAAGVNEAFFSYRDYQTWDKGERWEIIRGEASLMTPAPPRRHQEISVELARQFSNFLLEKTCRLYTAPFDVRLGYELERDEDIQTVVQPDISVVCDRARLDEKGCLGAPDLIVEILSPGTSRRDWKEKFSLYEEFGVREYWIVDPPGQTVVVFSLGADGRYGRPTVYTEDDKISVSLLEGLVIELGSVFRE